MSRAAASSRFSATAVIAAAVVAVTAVASLTTRPAPAPTGDDAPPSAASLRRADLVCAPGARDLRVLSVPGTEGTATRVVDGADATDVDLVRGLGRVAAVDTASVVSARGDLAPGLVAGGTGLGRSPRPAPCVAPAGDRWFTAAGAGSESTSTLLLTNPDPGPAAVDVVVWARRRELSVPSLRGIQVPARSTLAVDLGETIPRRTELLLHVHVSRGRVGALVESRLDPIGGAAPTASWSTGQAEPLTDSLLLGVPRGDGTQDLVVANPGDSEARFRLQVVTGESSFVPSDLESVRVPPDQSVTLALGRLLARATRDGAVGLRLESSEPVTATLRTVVEDRLITIPAAAPEEGTAAAVLPAMPQPVGRTLVLGGVETRGRVDVRFLDVDGRELDGARPVVGAGAGATVDVPPRAVAVIVEGTGPLLAAVRVPGSGIVPLTVPAVDDQVPSVVQRPLGQTPSS
jgi:hypothetical protein